MDLSGNPDRPHIPGGSDSATQSGKADTPLPVVPVEIDNPDEYWVSRRRAGSDQQDVLATLGE
ncbi:hypothetical protein [Sedimenticola sp.]|uniref:hypothetical protein n=1 Tax=Sedimenticola sp. TaxID=1940285 RepID=UPI003D12094D